MIFVRLGRLGWRLWARCLLMKCLLKQDFPWKRFRFHSKIYASEILDTTTNYQNTIASWFPGFVKPCSRQNYILIMQWLWFLVNKNAACQDLSGTKFPCIGWFWVSDMVQEQALSWWQIICFIASNSLSWKGQHVHRQDSSGIFYKILSCLLMLVST